MALLKNLIAGIAGVRIVHRIPGRLRLHIPIDTGSLPSDINILTDLSDYVEAGDGILEVSYSPRSGNLLVTYNTDIITEATLLHRIRQLSSRLRSTGLRFALLPSSRMSRVASRIEDHFRNHPIDLHDERSFEVPDEVWR